MWWQIHDRPQFNQCSFDVFARIYFSLSSLVDGAAKKIMSMFDDAQAFLYSPDSSIGRSGIIIPEIPAASSCEIDEFSIPYSEDWIVIAHHDKRRVFLQSDEHAS